MTRTASLLVVAFAAMFAAMLCAGTARAQVSAAELITRIDRLEAAIRELTGTVEQLQYRNQQLEQQVQRLQQDAQGRTDEVAGRGGSRPPPAPSRPGPGAPYAPPAPLPPAAPVIAAAPQVPPAPVEPQPPSNRRGDAFDPTINPNAPGVPRPLGSVPPVPPSAEQPPPYGRPQVAEAPAAPAPRQPGAPLDLSTLSSRQNGAAPSGELPPPPPINQSATGAVPATLPPGATAKDEYDLGYGYILHKDYALAENTFRTFLRQYPSDRLAPEAQYWLGEALFQDQHFRDAAEAFLAVSTKYETTARAPDALLRLGMSLAAMGEKEAACASLGEVLRKYPRASLNVKQSVDREQKRAHC